MCSLGTPVEIQLLSQAGGLVGGPTYCTYSSNPSISLGINPYFLHHYHMSPKAADRFDLQPTPSRRKLDIYLKLMYPKK